LQPTHLTAVVFMIQHLTDVETASSRDAVRIGRSAAPGTTAFGGCRQPRRRQWSSQQESGRCGPDRP
jgi:hypothetical protein